MLACLVCFFLPFLVFLRPYPDMLPFFVLPSPCSSHLLLFRKSVFLLPGYVICILPHLRVMFVWFILHFFVVLISFLRRRVCCTHSSHELFRLFMKKFSTGTRAPGFFFSTPHVE